MNDLEMEFHKKTLLDKSKRFFKKDEKEASSDDDKMVEVKVLIALTDDKSGGVGKESAKNGDWVKIAMKKNSSNYEPKGLVFVKYSTKDNNVSKPNVERPWLSEAEESNSVSINLLPPLETLHDVESQTGPKTIKLVLKSCSNRKAKASKGGILKSRFPRIYALDTCKKATVRFKLVTSNLDSSLRRLVRGGEDQSQYDALTNLIGGVNLLPQTDRYAWTLDGTGEFTVSSIRKTIDDIRSPSVSSRTRWVKYMPIKLNVFAWKVKVNALPTRINISRRGIDFNSLSCPLCQHGVESSSHLFFNCELIRQLYSKIARW
nr:RNA-directed DNA polymerase, eukaryota [Tanacetum cinerariifolium]